MSTPAHPIRRLPLRDTPSGWVRPEELTRLGGDPLVRDFDTFNWVVVGAGFTGLAAARRLGELHPTARIALIDAQPVGWGSSGRNSGFIIDLPHKFDLESRDIDRLRAVMRLNGAAIRLLEGTVMARDIACEWSRAGKLQGAVKARGTGQMRWFMETLSRLESPYVELDRDEVASIIGTEHYAGAVKTPGCVLMNPVKLTRGLARNLPANVFVLDECPVFSIGRVGRRHRVEFVHAGNDLTITTPNLILATNAYTPEFGHLRNRVVPVMTYASMTRPLTADELAHIGAQRDWGLTPADAGGTTLRMTADGRLLVRNQYDYCDRYSSEYRDLFRVRKAHRASFLTRYPALADVPFVSTWGGVCGLSRNHVSYFGKLDEGVWSSACHNGVGVARGTISGHLIAEMASGGQSPLLSDMLATSNTPALNPPNPFLSLGVRTRLKLAAYESREEI